MRPYQMLLTVVLVSSGSLQAAEAVVALQRAAEAVAAAQQAAGGVVRGMAIGRGNIEVPAEVDPQDNVERMLILAPDGPIVVEAALRLDGAPYCVQREALIDEALKEGDVDGDGKVAWEEAIGAPRFFLSRYAAPQQNAGQKAVFIKQYDINGDGLADRYEIRRMFAALAGGAAFSVQPNPYRMPQPDVRTVLDVNGDGRITKEELAAAETRLKSRDANDNDLLEAAEAGGAANPYQGAFVAVNNGQMAVRQQAAQSVHLLGPTADLAAVEKELRSRYGQGEKKEITADCFPLFPQLLAELDLNKNGLLDSGETIGLHLVKPHVILEVNLGTHASHPAGLTVKSLANELGNGDAVRETFGETAAITLNGVKLQFTAQTAPEPSFNYAQAAESMIVRFDTDKNGYIDRKEVDTQQNAAYFVQFFERWDADRDGKVYAKEIEEDYGRQTAPQRSQVAAVFEDREPSLFATLDTTGDGRISLREMRRAGEALLTLDKNGDGEIGKDEMPGQIVVSFRRGNAIAGQVRTSAGGFVSPGTAASGKKGPEWFVRMDRNGDGDITLKEFLGTEDQFRQLDTNGDGFIELKEAEGAGAK